MQIDVYLITYALAGMSIILLGWVIYLHIKIRRLLVGKDAKSLEDTLTHAHAEIRELRKFETECLAYFTDVEKRLSRSIQAVETVRFNPFQGSGVGGNQSFSTVLLSEKGDGVVLSSLYSRDRVSIFSKPLSKFQSDFDMTEEELSVLTSAKAKVGINQK